MDCVIGAVVVCVLVVAVVVCVASLVFTVVVRLDSVELDIFIMTFFL